MLRADEAPVRGPRRRARTLRFARDSGVYHARSQGHAERVPAVRRARDPPRAARRTHRRSSCRTASPPTRARAAASACCFASARTDAIVGFDNRRGIFPIHRSVRFLLVTATRGGATRELRCRFGLQDPAVLDGLAERPPREALPIGFTPALLERLSGPDLAIPDVRSPDGPRARRALARCIRGCRIAGGWGAALRARAERHRRSRPLHAPTAAACRSSTDARRAVSRRTRPAPPARLARRRPRGCSTGRPRSARARLAFRDVASATNRTTLIAAIVPAGCVTTHTLFCLRTPLPRTDQWMLCALLNSYVANFLVRLRVTSHVSLSIVQALPVPRRRSPRRSPARPAAAVPRGRPPTATGGRGRRVAGAGRDRLRARRRRSSTWCSSRFRSSSGPRATARARRSAASGDDEAADEQREHEHRCRARTTTRDRARTRPPRRPRARSGVPIRTISPADEQPRPTAPAPATAATSPTARSAVLTRVPIVSTRPRMISVSCVVIRLIAPSRASAPPRRTVPRPAAPRASARGGALRSAGPRPSRPARR